mmetsp:Transcript_4093/g.9513  ORF Transcript_4093/g.9513 Transcript_4093/m.9513 type:complete len:1082 (-) Transcript_4093:117-3362(-)
MNDKPDDLKELVARLIAIESRIDITDNEMESIQRRLLLAERRISPYGSHVVPWRRIGASPTSPSDNVEHGDLPQEDVNPKEEYQLPMDIYTVISAWKIKSSAFCISVLVIGVQLLLLALLLVDQVGSTGTSSIVVFPTNVPIIVHVSQALATIIAIMGQDDLRIAIEAYFGGLPTRFNGDETFQQMGTKQWYFSCTIRFIQGFLSVVAAFVLAIQSETVFDVLLNFLGVRFVSDLDDLAFELSKLGYFGKGSQLASKRIVEARFQQDNRNKVDGNRSWFRKYAHVFGVFAVLAGVFASFLYVLISQNNGNFSVQEVTLEMADGTIPFSALFNGCYRASQSDERRFINRRIVYEQVGFEKEGGKFAYCDDVNGTDEKAWTFSLGEDFDPCVDFLVRSETTTTYNILEAGENQWFGRRGLSLDNIRLSRVLSSSECGGFDSDFQNEGCEQLDIDGYIGIAQNKKRSSSFTKTSIDVTKANVLTYQALTHPIYVGENSTTEAYDLIFFTGQNWVLTHPIEVDMARESETPISIQDYILNDDGFLSTLELIVEDGKHVDLVSEIGRSLEAYETPLGKRWFRMMDGEEDLGFNYPTPDQTRPVEVSLSCGTCNDASNPCFFDGICTEDQTCDCVNGGFGKLCQEAPLGDGLCNGYFNTELYGWDGGDCCGGTCSGPECGLEGISSPFGIGGKATIEEDTRGFGYEYCEDPSMAPLTIEFSNFQIYNESTWIPVFSDFGMPFCSTSTINVRCNGITYMHVPSYGLKNTSDCALSYMQIIHVPFGSSCEVSTKMGCFGPSCLNHDVSVYYGTSTESTPIMSGSVESQPQLSFGVPSECLTEVLLSQSSSIFDLSTLQGMAANTLSNDAISEFLCIKNHDLILERYALAVLNSTVQFKSTNWQAHQCHGWGIPAVKATCANDTITGLIVGADSYSQKGAIPTELALLTNVVHLALTGGAFLGTIPKLPTSILTLELWGNSLRGTIPSHFASITGMQNLALSENLLSGKIPTELSKLVDLLGLWLDTNQLTGTIPSELGSITKLQTLTMVGNSLTGEIPTEMENLSSLRYCEIDNSFTGGPALPVCNRNG